jgi:hypothetical protein
MEDMVHALQGGVERRLLGQVRDQTDFHGPGELLVSLSQDGLLLGVADTEADSISGFQGGLCHMGADEARGTGDEDKRCGHGLILQTARAVLNYGGECEVGPWRS